MMGHPINAHLNAIYFLLKRYRIGILAGRTILLATGAGHLDRGRARIWARSPRLEPLLGLSPGETHGKRWDGGAVGKFERRLIFDPRLIPYSMGVTPLSPSYPKLRPWIQSPVNRNPRTLSHC